MKKNILSSYFIILYVIYSLNLSAVALPPNFIDASTLTPSEGAFVSYLGPLTQRPTVVTSAGDVNGDGHEDLIIAAILSLENSVSTGLAYIVFGTETGIPNIDYESMTTSQGIRIRGASSGANLGCAVEGVGDVSGDGIDDVMVGSSGKNTVYVIFGKTSGLTDFDVSNFDSSQGIKLEGQPSSYFGYAIQNVGDINSDGINDIMISDPRQGLSGVMYVIFGRSSGLSPMAATDLDALGSTGRGFRIIGAGGNMYFGMSLSRAGDVNQDGVEDMMIGSILAPCSAGIRCGAVVVVYGSKNSIIPDIQFSTLSLSQGFKIIGALSGHSVAFPYTMLSAGDCNNDGIDDLILGAPSTPDSFGNNNVGLAYVIYGKAGGLTSHINLATFSPSQGYKIKGKAADAYLGNSASRGDIDGDGNLDLVLVSSGANIPELQHGIIYVIFNGLNGSTDIDFANEASLPLRVLKIFVNGQFQSLTDYGTIVKIANDLNGDGVNDIICTGTFGVYVIYGSKCERDTKCSSLPPLCYVSRGCVCGESDLFFQAGECVSQCSPQGYYVNTPICESKTFYITKFNLISNRLS